MQKFIQDLNENIYPANYNWNEESITSIIQEIPNLSNSLLYRCYDYFYALYNLKQLSKIHLNKVGEAIEKALYTKAILTQSQVELLNKTANKLNNKPEIALKLLYLIRTSVLSKNEVMDKINKLEKQLIWKKRLHKPVNWFVKYFNKKRFEAIQNDSVS